MCEKRDDDGGFHGVLARPPLRDAIFTADLKMSDLIPCLRAVDTSYDLEWCSKNPDFIQLWLAGRVRAYAFENATAAAEKGERGVLGPRGRPGHCRCGNRG